MIFCNIFADNPLLQRSNNSRKFIPLNIMRKTLLFSLVFSLSFSVFAQAPKYSNEFLAIGVGARALGMANATVAGVNDVTAGYWNPAGLLGITSRSQVGLQHAEYFASIAKYDYGAI